jgi:hypothetical protein
MSGVDIDLKWASDGARVNFAHTQPIGAKPDFIP